MSKAQIDEIKKFTDTSTPEFNTVQREIADLNRKITEARGFDRLAEANDLTKELKELRRVFKTIDQYK